MPQPVLNGTTEDWERVAGFVSERLFSIYDSLEQMLRESDSTASRSVWSIIVNHAQKKGTVAVASCRAICKTLHWTPNSIELILEGGEPVPLEGPRPIEGRLPQWPSVADGFGERLAELLEAHGRALSDHEDRLSKLEASRRRRAATS